MRLVTLSRAVIASLALAAVAARIVHVELDRRKAVRPFGKYTIGQILERSAPLCSALAHNAGSLRLSAVPIEVGPKGHADLRVWMVDGIDRVGGTQVHINWNADTGKLITVSHSTPDENAPRVRRAITRDQAVRIAGSWLATFGMFSDSTDWKPVDEPRLSQFIWRIEWRAERRVLAVTIDSTTGELMLAEAMTLSKTAPGSLMAAGRSLEVQDTIAGKVTLDRHQFEQIAVCLVEVAGPYGMGFQINSDRM
jgi:hypothetical protein